MKAYKGFNKDLQCTPGGKVFQFEEGGTYERPVAKLCEHGFHACEDPLNVFAYYPPGSGSRYFEVDLDGISDERGDDTKICGKKITLGAEIGIPGIIKAHVEYVKQNVTRAVEAGDAEAVSVGDKEAASAGWYGSASAGESGSASAGRYGSASAGEYGSAVSRGSASVGKNGLAVVRGNNVKAKGDIGTVIVICIEKPGSYDIAEWKAAAVDGETLKPGTWYTLKNGEFVEVTDETDEEG